MVKQLLEEVRHAPLDEASRARLREIYEQSVRELADGLSADLAAELDRMSIPFDDATPSDAELRIAQAQLVGWLEGLFHGIQATLVAQQVAARAQLDEMRQQALPPAAEAPRPGPAPTSRSQPITAVHFAGVVVASESHGCSSPQRGGDTWGSRRRHGEEGAQFVGITVVHPSAHPHRVLDARRGRPGR